MPVLFAGQSNVPREQRLLIRGEVRRIFSGAKAGEEVQARAQGAELRGLSDPRVRPALEKGEG